MSVRKLEQEIPEAEFAELAAGLAADSAPRRFALLVEEGEREDGWIVGWGLAFPDHAYVVGVDGQAGLEFRDMGWGIGLPAQDSRMRLVWVDQPHPENE